MSIVLDHVSKIYELETVVNDLSLSIEAGELFVLLGASGSGKSTLLRMIAGLTETDSGTIHFADRDVSQLPTQERGVGFVFQNYSLFQHLTAAQNIAFGLDVKGLSRKEKNKRVQEMLELIDLVDYGNRRPAQLSGGQQQRVALARALAPKPDVLLLDEPFGALDVNIRTQLRHNLREIQQELGITAILVTHDQEEAFELADRIGIIDAGQLLEVGKPDALYRRPAHRFTASFLGTVNLMRGISNGQYLHLNEIRLPLLKGMEHLSGQAVDVMARPESIFLTSTAQEQKSHVLGQGTVISMSFAGPMERVVLQMESGNELQVLMNLNRSYELGLYLGAQVWAGIRDYHLLPAI